MSVTLNPLSNACRSKKKMDKTAEDCIIAWIRNMDGIPGHFDKIGQSALDCETEHEKTLRQQVLAADTARTIIPHWFSAGTESWTMRACKLRASGFSVQDRRPSARHTHATDVNGGITE